jgi:translation initiation factor 2B subunit (eIF-2B alpha/beta/delta family)
MAMKKTEKTRTHFTSCIDTWTLLTARPSSITWPASRNYTLAMATYRAAIKRWPNTPITLRQGARVIEDSRCLRLAETNKSRQGGR